MWIALALLAATPWVPAARAEEAASQPVRQLVATAGQGYLELVDGYRVLHLKGGPREMGRQHGLLLRQAVRENCDFLLSDEGKKPVKLGEITIPRTAMAGMLCAQFMERIPADYLAEMQALAEAAGMPPGKLIGCNLIPEMFHCSGFALLKDATAERKLYHGRVLDYAVDLRLQEHAVLIIQEPDGGAPFVNVGYAGFIGSVTGMNLHQVSIGEMGGGGQGRWNGVPMSFLVRKVLQEAKTLEEALAVFQDNPRTCEYYYVIADAKSDSAVGVRAVPEAVEVIKAGEAHPLLPTPLPNTVIMSAGKRYVELVNRIKTDWGRFTQPSAIRLMDAPVAMKHNLHDVLMVPADGMIYVANAAADGSPAWQQKYYRFDIRRLLSTRPSEKAKPM
jgi:hypothetical protein